MHKFKQLQVQDGQRSDCPGPPGHCGLTDRRIIKNWTVEKWSDLGNPERGIDQIRQLAIVVKEELHGYFYNVWELLSRFD